MSKTGEELVEELISVIIKQGIEIRKLQKKIDQIKQYIEVYEDYIKRGEY